MTVVWTARAIRDRDAIHAFVARSVSPEHANATILALVRAIARLEQFPNLGRPGAKPGMRELVVPRLPYRVPYRVRGEQVQIVRILHQHRGR